MSINKSSIKIVQVCTKCQEELGKDGYRYINGTRYCGWCARGVKAQIDL